MKIECILAAHVQVEVALMNPTILLYPWHAQFLVVSRFRPAQASKQMGLLPINVVSGVKCEAHVQLKLTRLPACCQGLLFSHRPASLMSIRTSALTSKPIGVCSANCACQETQFRRWFSIPGPARMQATLEAWMSWASNWGPTLKNLGTFTVAV